jgi:hypothetical protein
MSTISGKAAGEISGVIYGGINTPAAYETKYDESNIKRLRYGH